MSTVRTPRTSTTRPLRPSSRVDREP
jgi:hypothetical protein